MSLPERESVPPLGPWPATLKETTELLGFYRGLCDRIDKLQDIPLPHLGDTQSSNVFRSIADAWNYYQPLGCDWAEVVRKGKDGEIQIGFNCRGFVAWDNDKRAIISTPQALIEQDFENMLKGDRYKAFGITYRVEDHIKWRRLALKAVRNDKHRPELISFKKHLRERVKLFIEAPWPNDKPYCCFGRPFYGPEDYDKEYAKPTNHHVLRFTFRDSHFVLTRSRILTAPKGHCWGMMEGGHHLFLFAGDGRTLLSGAFESNELTRAQLYDLINETTQRTVCT